MNQLFGAFIETKALPAPQGEGLAIQLRFREKQQERKRRRGVGQVEKLGQKQEVGQGEEVEQEQEAGQGAEQEEEADHAHPEVYLRFSLQKENMVCTYKLRVEGVVILGAVCCTGPSPRQVLALPKAKSAVSSREYQLTSN